MAAASAYCSATRVPSAPSIQHMPLHNSFQEHQANSVQGHAPDRRSPSYHVITYVTRMQETSYLGSSLTGGALHADVDFSHM